MKVENFSSDAGRWQSQISFIAGPDRYALATDQRFRIRVEGEKRRMGRDLWIVSTQGLTKRERKEMTKRYLNCFQRSFVSFPLKERASHLMTRIDGRVFNFGRFIVNWIPRFRKKEYLIPRGRALETVVVLQGGEYEKLQSYLANILQNRSRTIGAFGMEGCQFTNNRIQDNRPLSECRKRHNCSSWIATAPIGEDRNCLLEALGGKREVEIATNPGWWTNWILATADKGRLGPLILWTPRSVMQELAKLESGSNFPWDFNKH